MILLSLLQNCSTIFVVVVVIIVSVVVEILLVSASNSKRMAIFYFCFFGLTSIMGITFKLTKSREDLLHLDPIRHGGGAMMPPPPKKKMFLTTVLERLTLPLQSLLVPTPFTNGGRAVPPKLSQKQLSDECEILQDIRDIFECLRNVKVVYIVFTWLP